jgi:hypothetical protein
VNTESSYYVTEDAFQVPHRVTTAPADLHLPHRLHVQTVVASLSHAACRQQLPPSQAVHQYTGTPLNVVSTKLHKWQGDTLCGLACAMPIDKHAGWRGRWGQESTTTTNTQ